MTLVAETGVIEHTGEKCKAKEKSKMTTKIVVSRRRPVDSNRRSYSVLMREALERFKGRKRSRKYVLSDQQDTINDHTEVNNDHCEINNEHSGIHNEHYVNKYNIEDFTQPQDIVESTTSKTIEQNHYRNVDRHCFGNTTKSYEQMDCDHDPVQKHVAKHRHHQIKKYFSSPIHKRKIDVNDAGNQQTYVSYQDDYIPEYFTDASPERVMEINGKTSSGNMVSPSNSDDVFDDVAPTITDIPHQSSTTYQQHNYFLPHEQIGISMEKLAPHIPDFNGCDIVETKCSIPNCNNMVKVIRPNGVEQLMTAADLHASLDNALHILDESTKLLQRDSNPNSAPYFASRQTSPHGGHNYFFPANRPRVYSTGSRLETIAEENDRSDESREGTNKRTTDIEDNYHKETEQRDIQESIISGMGGASTQFSFGTLATNDCCDSIVSSETSIFLSTAKYQTTSNSNTYGSLVRPHDRTMYGAKERSHSTSTISVRNLPSHDNTQGDILLQTFGNKQPGDICSACDWIRRHMPFASANAPVPPHEWQNIMQMVSRNACGHYHAWGLCENKNCEPSLCHSHYLQFYQYLQKNEERNRRRRIANSCSSQADSVIDYDINEVLSSLDEVISYSDVSLSRHPNYSRRKLNHHHKIVGHSNLTLDSSDDSGQIQRAVDKCPMSDSASINSDSAFSTNGSPTPSTRDGVNTDRESLDSLPIANFETEFSSKTRQQELPKTRITKHNEITQGHIYEWRKNLASSEAKYNRYSMESSEDSSHGNYDSRDSAVYLHDSSSSHTTNLSSESFSSSNTFNRARLHKIESMNYRDATLSSSSEESLVSEGTLCLSDMEALKNNRTTSNDSLFSLFRIGCQETQFLGPAGVNRISKACQRSESSTTDTLTSSSSDSNTLSSGSSGRSYLTFRSSTSTSVYNTLDSSSCVSTDDTGDTIIYQGKRISSSPKQKYHQSAFHYQNLNIPVVENQVMPVQSRTCDNMRLRTISETSGGKPNYYPKSSELPHTYRSLSLSCIVTSSKLCYYGIKANSTPDLYSSLTNIHLHTAKVDYNENIVEKEIIFTEKCNSTQTDKKNNQQQLSDRVDQMIQNCSYVSSVLESLKGFLQDNSIEKANAEDKILEMEKALKEKDAIVNQLYNTITSQISLNQSST